MSKVNSNQWLNGFARNVTSIRGEDGIIEKIFEVIKDTNNWCVEFGAGDGHESSNTFNLIENKNYSAVLIEADSHRFKKLQTNYKEKTNVVLIKTSIGFTTEDCLDKILKTTNIPLNLDLLSIDIDGNDYHVWEAVKCYRPKVVIIEFNPTIPNLIEFVQPRDLRINQGSSLLSICKLAQQKRYELVATTYANAIFVDVKYFPLFEIKDNSINQMRSDESAITYIFSGFDGTIFLRGCRNFFWGLIPYDERKIQQIPKFLRCFPPNYGKFKLLLAGLYFYLYRRYPLPDNRKELLRKAFLKLFNQY